jgi:flavin reductase (DIM6/NTAB) family NADH-FMN oxidoreductase RutF
MEWTEQAGEMLAQLTRGAFLTTAWEGRVNTMTIGWGQLGFIWSRPIFTVLVRPTRFSFGLLEQSREFTVSLPDGDMEEELAVCGSTSGRDGDKFAAAGLTAMPSQVIATPVVGGCALYYECRVLYQHTLAPLALDPSVASMYTSNDHHTVYHGEIVAAYHR